MLTFNDTRLTDFKTHHCILCCAAVSFRPLVNHGGIWQFLFGRQYPCSVTLLSREMLGHFWEFDYKNGFHEVFGRSLKWLITVANFKIVVMFMNESIMV